MSDQNTQNTQNTTARELPGRLTGRLIGRFSRPLWAFRLVLISLIVVSGVFVVRPWWTFAAVAFIGGGVLPSVAEKLPPRRRAGGRMAARHESTSASTWTPAAVAAEIAVASALSWVGAAIYQDILSGGRLSGRIAGVFSVPFAPFAYLATALLAGLVGGLAGWCGRALRMDLPAARNTTSQ